MSFGPHFCKWVSIFYNKPLGRVKYSGSLSTHFPIARGTKQGCHLSQLVYNLAIEPLAALIRRSQDIKGLVVAGNRLVVAGNHYKINLFADDDLMLISDPLTSLPNLWSHPWILWTGLWPDDQWMGQSPELSTSYSKTARSNTFNLTSRTSGNNTSLNILGSPWQPPMAHYTLLTSYHYFSNPDPFCRLPFVEVRENSGYQNDVATQTLVCLLGPASWCLVTYSDRYH